MLSPRSKPAAETGALLPAIKVTPTRKAAVDVEAGTAGCLGGLRATAARAPQKVVALTGLGLLLASLLVTAALVAPGPVATSGGLPSRPADVAALVVAKAKETAGAAAGKRREPHLAPTLFTF